MYDRYLCLIDSLAHAIIFTSGNFFEADLAVDGVNIDMPILPLLYGRDNRIVLIEAAAEKPVKLFPSAKLQL